MLRRIIAPGLVTGVLAATYVVWPTLASAVILSSVTSGTLTVTSDDADDVIEIRCGNDDNVKINRARPDSGAFPCIGVTSIVVVGGGGDDEIQLKRVETTSFTSLATVSIDGGPGWDSIEGSQGPDTISGGDGKDRITIDPSLTDVVDGGLARDFVSVEIAGETTISDSSVALASIEFFVVRGSDGDDTIDASGYSGRLDMEGRGGHDTLVGGSGRNSLDGGSQDDVLVGGPDVDRFTPGRGNDSVKGRGGNDFLGDNPGSDLLVGGPGNDEFFQVTGSGNELRGGPGTDLLSLQTTGSARLTDSAVRYELGRAALSSIDRASFRLAPERPGSTLDASGFSGATLIQGDFGDDVLIGGSGRDEIQASAGDDTLVGGAGNDRLFGGDGIDACDGGLGRNRLVDCE
jgi:Ca2+-binding RTX toxin-like protein